MKCIQYILFIYYNLYVKVKSLSNLELVLEIKIFCRITSKIAIIGRSYVRQCLQEATIV
jgi:hypothetical protein